MVSALWSFSQEYFRSALARSVYYLAIAKYSWKNFCSTLKNWKSRKFSPMNLLPFTVLYSQESSSKFKMFKILNTGKGSKQYISILLHKAIRFTSFQLYYRLSISLYTWLYRAWQTITVNCVDSKIDLKLFISIAVIWVSNLYNDMYLDIDIEPA